ncbi:acetate kinase [Larkinella knui]|uniref:Acetate kinase n=1 Tax=Larkinella knui TaxID=2025310 RepID=A0A3P1CDW6_9BACT|nr:acetate kinase [Larkinella knui]RRB11521.1 acetate kinase [Larkinella knui]
MYILIINAGSSSLKYQLFNMPAPEPLCTGLIERIGTDHSLIRHTVPSRQGNPVFEQNEPIASHARGFEKLVALLSDSRFGVIRHPDEIVAIGHRVVHGGEGFTQATLITPEVKEKIRSYFPLAPLHTINFTCIEIAEMTFPKAQQVAVFDTAFHQTMPEYAFRYAIPEALYRQEGIRVYGFHGTSHKYVSEKAAAWLRKPEAKLISIHLGNGCSITAIQNGRSLDTSMGFSPLAGLVMGTRSGDIDPAVVFHLMANGYSPDEVYTLLNKQSGMAGLTGFSDMRDIKKLRDEGNPAAELASELYAYRVKKYIGAFAAVLNGLDAVLFTGGVGENDSDMRARICRNLDFLGIHLDPDKNKTSGSGLREINPAQAGVKILVVPTNEELEIARQSFALLETD